MERDICSPRLIHKGFLLFSDAIPHALVVEGREHEHLGSNLGGYTLRHDEIVNHEGAQKASGLKLLHSCLFSLRVPFLLSLPVLESKF